MQMGRWVGRAITTVLLALTACACGGRSRAAASDPIGELGESGSSTASHEPWSREPGSSGAAAGGMDSGSAGAVADLTDAAGSPGTVAEAGPAGAPYDAPIASGTRRCDNEDYCFGLACYAPDAFGPTVCLARCDSDANCRPSEACLRAPKLEPTCYARCKSPEDCYDGFDCYDFSGKDELVCFPTPWAQRRDDLGY
ncbi:MAG TPA: hypothetical protein VGL19_10130 [Polyangiaceae bacterium]